MTSPQRKQSDRDPLPLCCCVWATTTGAQNQCHASVNRTLHLFAQWQSTLLHRDVGLPLAAKIVCERPHYTHTQHTRCWRVGENHLPWADQNESNFSRRTVDTAAVCCIYIYLWEVNLINGFSIQTCSSTLDCRWLEQIFLLHPAKEIIWARFAVVVCPLSLSDRDKSFLIWARLLIDHL